MQFLSNGDYIFPFNAFFYWVKQVYMWSYQTGAANPDGIIRLPGRLLDILVFALFGNIAIGYFYIFSSLIVVFFAFFYFCRKFLEVKNTVVALMSSLFFACNPIFLGNLSKVGLILAAAMLPLSLTVIRQAFVKGKLRYLLFWILFLNISLIHPFTFTVNLFVSGSYFAYLAWKDRRFVQKHIGKFLVVGVLALLLNMYFILPLASMGTVSKGVLSSDITSSPIDYTSLVEVANTGDIFTGLSLSKNVLKDYGFYDTNYTSFYFLGSFALYAILLGVYLHVEPRLGVASKRRFIVFLVAFLVLIMLAAAKFLHVDALLKLLIGLPGGWMFRSPLKWQLYIPLPLFATLALLLAHVKRPSRRALAYGGLAICFLLMNAFICIDIYKKLLTPRSLHYFSALQAMDLDHKNILLVGTDRCFTFASRNPEVMTELNQVLISKDTQVKQIGMNDIGSVNLSSYGFVLGCQDTMQQTLAESYHFKLTKRFADDAFQLYANQTAQPYIYATADVFALGGSEQLGNKYDFATQTLRKGFDFIRATSQTSAPDATSLQDTFEGLSFANIHGYTITTNIAPGQHAHQTLFVKNTGQKLYYTSANNRVSLSPVAQNGYTPMATTSSASQTPLQVAASKTVHFSYTDPSYDYKNLIPNPSLEQGTWRRTVGDCYAYDSQANLGMSLNTRDKSDGKQSLQLQAQDHIACTGPSGITVKPGQHYLLNFDYQNVGGQYAGYYISFDDKNNTYLSDRLDGTTGKWQTFSKDIVVPAGAHQIQMLVYAYPDSSGVTKGTALYDHFQMTAVPDIQDHFYLVGTASKQLKAPAHTNYQTINPTKTAVHVTGATTPFYLATGESYSAQWRLALRANASVPFAHAPGVSATDHVSMNGSMNGWYVDPAVLCASSSSACAKHADGSYDLDLVMEFAPQQWLETGLIISGLALVVTVLYFVRDARRDLTKERYWRWRR